MERNAAAGCRGCHDDPPYVPYSIGSAVPRAGAPEDAGLASAPPVLRAEAGSDPFAGEAAAVAPPGLAQWTVDGLALTAPEGRVFVLAVVRDFDDDGVKDAFAIARPSDGNDPGQLVFYRGGALGTPVTFDPPSELTRDATCTPIDRLEVLGGHSVLVELGAQCPMRPSTKP